MATKIKPHSIASAGCLIIGDEVLNGKIQDTNSHTFAKYCFNNLSIPLKRVLVCGDDKEDIVKSLDFLIKQDKVDLIVTSGGLGSTHDDITYDVISEYFNLKNELDSEVVQRMQNIRGNYIETLNPEQLAAYFRMATIPTAHVDSPFTVDKYFTDESLWFPIVGVNSQVYILPGIPTLFNKLLESFEPHLHLRIVAAKPLKRLFVKTDMRETEFAPFLGKLQKRVDNEFGSGIVKLGSYPHIHWGINTISIIGQVPGISEEQLRGLVNVIVPAVKGEEIQKEEEEKYSREKK